ncbi:MAG TPA: response regulator transcription factor [Patescibacteria group bacterium]|nr:response regulator transcription factor [Patescibacteria group bacterium]
MPGKTILLVDDDPEIVKTVRHYLQQEGYAVLVANNGLDALVIVRDQAPDCIVLDVLLPDLVGWDIIQRIRADPRTAEIPIIMLTARVADSEKVLGLELGADDYMTKPFNPRELLARIRARLRRSQPTRPARQIRIGRLNMDLDRHLVTAAGEEIDLTPTEFDLLRTLMQHPGYVFSRDELLEEAVGYTFEGLGRTLDSHIKNLRRKIDTDGHQYIQTVYGIGYRLTESPS